MIYYSQAGQDKWVHEMMGDSGFFVDCGAYDGIQTSNTYALEKLGWKGICIEANKDAFEKCKQARGLMCLHAAITDYKGKVGFGFDTIGGDNIVDCYRIQDILDGIFLEPFEIDYLSMDIEGGEFTALKDFPFDRWKFKLMTIEHNLYCDGPAKKNALYELLTRNGYRRVIEDVKCLDPNPLYFNQPFEDWYVNETFYK
jgi:hypothetical protein